MSCMIGLLRGDKKIISIDCTDEKEVLSILTQWYGDKSRVLKLMDLGNLYSLGKTLEYEHSYYPTISYHRDKNIDWNECKPKVHNDLDDFLSSNNNLKYLFVNNEWKIFHNQDFELNSVWDK